MPNKWYQIVAVHVSGNQKYYVNGQKVYDGTDYGWTSSGTLTEPLFVGLSSARFTMDDIRLYKRALSDGEISSAYQALASR